MVKNEESIYLERTFVQFDSFVENVKRHECHKYSLLKVCHSISMTEVNVHTETPKQSLPRRKALGEQQTHLHRRHHHH